MECGNRFTALQNPASSVLRVVGDTTPTMKTLFLLRHARAIPGSSSVPDFERPLDDNGRRQAERMGVFFREQKHSLDLVLSSTALRARETTEIFLNAAESLAEVRYEQRIYEASRPELLEMVATIEGDRRNVLLVGHNPGFEEMLQQLTGRSGAMAPSSLAKISFEMPAAPDEKAMGNLDWLVNPN